MAGGRALWLYGLFGRHLPKVHTNRDQYDSFVSLSFENGTVIAEAFTNDKLRSAAGIRFSTGMYPQRPETREPEANQDDR